MKDNEKRILKEFLKERNRLWSYSFSMTRDFHLSDEVIQEVALALIQQADRYNPQRHFMGWAIGITRNQTLKALRKQGKHAAAISCEETLDALAERLCERPNYQAERFNALNKCMSKVSSENRRVLNLKYLEKKSAEEIAALIDRSETATFSLLQRLRASLSKCIKLQLLN